MVPERLPIMPLTLPMFVLSSLSWRIKSFVYRSICLWDGQSTFCPHLGVKEWLCVILCSLMYQPLLSVRSKRIIAGHPHRHELVFSAPGSPCISQAGLFIFSYMIYNTYFYWKKKLRTVPELSVLLTERPQTISCMVLVLFALSRLLPYLMPNPCSHEYRL